MGMVIPSSPSFLVKLNAVGKITELLFLLLNSLPAHSRSSSVCSILQAALNSIPRMGEAWHLPGEGERARVDGPCLQDAGDGLKVISVAGEV